MRILSDANEDAVCGEEEVVEGDVAMSWMPLAWLISVTPC